MMKYLYLSGYPQIFLTMTGLQLDEFEELVSEVGPLYEAAEQARLNRPARQRALGGGDHPDLAVRDQILMTIIWLRQRYEVASSLNPSGTRSS